MLAASDFLRGCRRKNAGQEREEPIMYFSKHNQKIVYINHYSGLLEVEGSGPLCREDAEVWPKPTENLAREYHTLSIREGITEVGEGFLDAFPYLDVLILSCSVRSVALTPEALRNLKKRRVLIRGEYDTFAERFAEENKLDFLHSDIPLAVYDIEAAHEHDIVTLRFHEDGPPDIHFNCFTPGSSAGNYGGGEYSKKLTKNFYIGCSAESFAESFSDRAREQILANAMLKRFLENSNRRHSTKKAGKRQTKTGTEKGE